MLTEEQLSTIKQQLIENIKKSFPEDKKQFAISQIEEMNSEQLEEFLEKNNIKLSKEGGPNSCIFCSIAEGKIESYRVGENNDAVAVLEINPISKGHTIIIPKEHLYNFFGIHFFQFYLCKIELYFYNPNRRYF